MYKYSLNKALEEAKLNFWAVDGHVFEIWLTNTNEHKALVKEYYEDNAPDFEVSFITNSTRSLIEAIRLKLKE